MVIIVLDSNLLHGRADPEAASQLKPILALAAQVKVGVAIPEACLIELREGMREDLIDAQKALTKALGKLKELRV